MLDSLSLVFAFTLLSIGAWLVYFGLSDTGRSGSASVLAGATFVSFGAAIAWIVLTNWWKFRKVRKRIENE